MKVITLQNIDEARAFASQVGTTKGYIDILCCGSRRPSPELARRIEIASGGEVTVLESLFPHESAENVHSR